MVRRLLEEREVHTIDADSVGHEVIRPDGPAFAEVAARWPQVVEGGEVNRAALAEVVFADSQELAALEGITHPHIFAEIARRVEDIGSGVVVEMPLLGRSLGEDWRQLVVDCRDEIKLERAVARGMTEADARARIAAQPWRAEWLATADAVIPNHGSIEDLERAVAGIVGRL